MFDDVIALMHEWRDQGLPEPIYAFMEKWEKKCRRRDEDIQVRMACKTGQDGVRLRGKEVFHRA